MVYVLSKDGQPLMPTENHAKVRVLLKNKRAAVVKRCPFTIRLLYESTAYTQPVKLGVDAGSGTIGLSATVPKKVLYEAEILLRNDIVDLLSTRRELRRSRRNRKTRYRKKRFLNRRRPEGWLAPSVQNKVDCHLKVVDDILRILPVSEIFVETAAFDIQKIRKPDISGKEYQEGVQLGFWNVREYVLFRDGHTCQCCKGKSKDPVLNVHHIESRKSGGDAPNNLVTLCRACHDGYHRGTVKLPESIRRGKSFRDAAFMGIMRWAFFSRLGEQYLKKNIPVHMTFGYLTKNTRIEHGLPKGHRVDARCISGNPLAESPEEWFFQKKVRCHNRQIHKAKTLKGGIRKRNQAPYKVKGFCLNDKVRYRGIDCFITGRRSSGYFALKTLEGTKVHDSAKASELKLLERGSSWLTERRTAGVGA